ncbi:coiled-coil domain-containing protein 9 [Agelaius phoeniceus]|uniref:coiled-coil domain-containing protein 9 n=1 Tax=Agelaius phoeniceus TaxID=39638 RepID=UPI0040551C66
MAAALEKDAELDRRIAALRRKNEALVRRYQEIEEDRRRAEREGGAVTSNPFPKNPKSSLTVPKKPQTPLETPEIEEDRRRAERDRGGSAAGGATSAAPSSSSSSSSRDPQDPRDPRDPPPEFRGAPRGGGEGPGPGLGGGGAGTRPRRARGRGGGAGGDGGDRKSQEWEQRRLQNIEQMNEEMEKIAEYERSRREGLQDRNPVRNFLDDPRRCGPEPGGGPGGGPRRHQRNWGGPDFGKATARRGGRSRFSPGSPPLDPTLWMTGRQRAEHERWKRERERIDRERLQRHRDNSGAWRREWDAQKPGGLFSGVPEEPEGEGPPWAPPLPPPRWGVPAPPPPRPAQAGPPQGGGAALQIFWISGNFCGYLGGFCFHDDRWEPPPEPPPEPERAQVPQKVPEGGAAAPGGVPGGSQEDSDQWEDLSEEEEEEEEEEEGPGPAQREPETPSDPPSDPPGGAGDPPQV